MGHVSLCTVNNMNKFPNLKESLHLLFSELASKVEFIRKCKTIWYFKNLCCKDLEKIDFAISSNILQIGPYDPIDIAFSRRRDV